MDRYDILIKNGTIIDGTGGARFHGDIAIRDGKIAAVGPAIAGNAHRTIDAAGLIVAPGIIDLHTHYDAQIHWDPYCTSSGWHGTTTVVFSNCGFGYAPCRPEHADRYMRMMATTEQLPYEAQKLGLSWDWSSFPEWMAYLRALPKGVNVAIYLPMNPLLCYVMGIEASKTRPATKEERRRMRELLHEAMDAGASGFSLTWMGGEGNSHVDFDHSPMPTDIMDPEEAYNLADVLRERGEGVIQVTCEIATNARREIAEQLAHRSGRPVLHNLTLPIEGFPELHRATLAWLSEVHAKGLPIMSQGVTLNSWQEFKISEYNSWDAVAVFRQISLAGSTDQKIALARDPAYRERLRNEFDSREYAAQTASTFEDLILIRAPGSAAFQPYLGKSFRQIAEALGQPITDVFLDIAADTAFEAAMKSANLGGGDDDSTLEILRHDRVVPGVSDGGAHLKTSCNGQWSTDLLVRIGRDQNMETLENLHHFLSGKTAEMFGFDKLGLLCEGYAADIMIYDLDRLGYDRDQFEVRDDLPGGDWRLVCPATGIHQILVNGVATFVDGVCTGAVPGTLISNRRGTTFGEISSECEQVVAS